MIRVEDFVERHGGMKMPVEGNTWLLPDGACVVFDGFGPRLIEPGPNPEKRLRDQIRYAEIALRHAEDAQKTMLLADQCGVRLINFGLKWEVSVLGPIPTEMDRFGNPDPEALRRRLREIVSERRARLTELTAELAALPSLRARELATNGHRLY